MSDTSLALERVALEVVARLDDEAGTVELEEVLPAQVVPFGARRGLAVYRVLH
jgi:hypothetical protein